MSLEMKSKRDVAQQHLELVAAIMDLWVSFGRRMNDWRDPLSAVRDIETVERLSPYCQRCRGTGETCPLGPSDAPMNVCDRCGGTGKR